jgi:hypothetical protein
MNLHRLARVIVRIAGLCFVLEFLLLVCHCAYYLDAMRDFLDGDGFSISSDLLGYVISLALYFISGFVLLRYTDQVIDWLQVDRSRPLVARKANAAIDAIALEHFAIFFIRLTGWTQLTLVLDQLTHFPRSAHNAFMHHAPHVVMLDFIWYIVGMLLLVGFGVLMIVKASRLARLLAMAANERGIETPRPPDPGP